MKTIKVRVTAKDIEAGCPADAYACPVYLALRRHFPRGYVIAGQNNLRLPRRRFVPTPPSVAQWMERFDSLNAVQPFTFTLKVPE